MKVISLLQPWATLVAIGAKRIETRSWATSYRGPLAIHASKGVTAAIKKLVFTKPFFTILRKLGYGVAWGADWNLPLGKIIATCNLVDVVPITPEFTATLSENEKAFGNYTPGRFAWILEDVKQLPEPIPAKGSLGLWEFPGL
ncbi:MAG: ASCH domain-containing protein [Firmicutes bacterium]|nr:ASCH domain-containing protein [Bacillota bacterium]